MNDLMIEDIKKIFKMADVFNDHTLTVESSPLFDKNRDDIKDIFDKYCDDFESLDPYLKKLTEILAEMVLKYRDSFWRINEIFAVLHILFQYRGFKVLQNYLPHDATCLELIVGLLENSEFSNCDNKNNWKSRYCLLVWLSIIIMIPIRLDKFDDPTDLSKSKITKRVYDICLKYTSSLDPCDEVAPYLTARFFMRKDTQQNYLKPFVNALLNNLQSRDQLEIKITSLMQLSSLLKYLQRETLLDYVDDILLTYFECNLREIDRKKLLQFSCKVIRRLALVLLQPISQGYRYKRRDIHYIGDMQQQQQQPDNIIDYSGKAVVIPENIDKIINELIEFLPVSDEDIRCSAAKGISVIFERLPSTLVDDILEFILNLFNEKLGDPLWHGGCVTLAFLSLNGLLPPKYLDSILPVIKEALFFEVKLSSGTIGNMVRDSACFVCWSFARAFDAIDVKPFMEKIGSYLIIVALFDQQVNCRRAAAAAFQENFGRLGVFAHGFDILPLLQFHRVSNKNITYLTYCPFVCQFEQYRYDIIEHLINVKIIHWDVQIRKLASSAMFSLTFYLSRDEIFELIFDKLIAVIKTSFEIDKIHGALLTLSNTLLAYSIRNHDVINRDEQLVIEIKNLISFIRKSKRIAGNCLIKESFCLFIENVTYSKLSLSGDDPVLLDWIDFLKEGLNESTVVFAASALSAVLNQYYSGESHVAFRRNLIDYLFGLLKTNSEETKIACLITLRSLPFVMVTEFFTEIIEVILNEMVVNEKTFRNVQSRKNATIALRCILLMVLEECTDYEHIDFVRPFNSLLLCSKDYTKTTCGDVGRFVREEAIDALEKLTLALANNYLNFFRNRSELLHSILASMAQQAVDKIDKIRILASKAFQNIIYCRPCLNEIAHLAELKEIIHRNDIFENEDVIFSKFVEMCLLPDYNYCSHVLLGLISSMTTCSETIKLIASEKLIDLIKQQNIEQQLQLFQNVVKIFEIHKKKRRIMKSFPEFLCMLFRAGHFNNLIEHFSTDLSGRIYRLLRSEIIDKNDISNFGSAVELLGFLVHAKSICRQVLTQLLEFLSCDNHFVRKKTIAILYECLLVYGSDLIADEDRLDAIITLISDFEFNNDDFSETQTLKSQLEAAFY